MVPRYALCRAVPSIAESQERGVPIDPAHITIRGLTITYTMSRYHIISQGQRSKQPPSLEQTATITQTKNNWVQVATELSLTMTTARSNPCIDNRLANPRSIHTHETPFLNPSTLAVLVLAAIVAPCCRGAKRKASPSFLPIAS